MRFSIKLYCFVLVLNFVGTKTLVEYIFNAMPLGHSGLLIYWTPNITFQIEETTKDYLFSVKNRIVGEENYTSNGKRYNSSEGQFKIPSLNENTLYEVIVEQYDSDNVNNSLFTYSMKRRTKPKSNEKPVKPYFEIVNDSFFIHKIRWYPCGRERICNNHVSGTHFGITVTDLYSTRKNIVTREEFDGDYIVIILWSGRMYELNVYSINGESKTESDSQEIFLKPRFTLVQYVNIISLPESTVLISWKPPKHSVDDSLNNYLALYANFKTPNTDHVIFLGKLSSLSLKGLFSLSYEQIRLPRVEPNVLYTYNIAAMGYVGMGFEYTFQYKYQVYDDNLEIAKPDFNYKLVPENGECRFGFQWLPCGQSFDCKNTKPGSYYSFEFKPEPVDKTDVASSVYYTGIFDVDLKYYVTLKSSIGSNFSEPVTKIFENCKEIQENILSGEKNQN